MGEKNTKDFENEIIGSYDIKKYLEKHEDEFDSMSLSEYLNILLMQKKMTKNQVIRNSDINLIYGYQIFAGDKKPSRDKLIMLAVGFKLSLYETNRFLKNAGMSPLYARVKRDACLIYCMSKNYNMIEINNMLYEIQEKLLS